jgi:hypothetical protein
LTLALAIIGTVTGLIALAVTIRREWLDRPRVLVSASPMTSPDGSGYIDATVENHGRQPVIVKGVGLEARLDPGVLPAREGDAALFSEPWNTLMNDPWSRERLDGGGGHMQLRWQVPPSLDLHADTPIRPFADYGIRRRAWGEPFAYFRVLFAMGWRPASPPAHFLDDRAGVKAKAVEPRWKLWKPRHLRRDTAPRPLPDLAAKVEQIRQRFGANSGAAGP